MSQKNSNQQLDLKSKKILVGMPAYNEGPVIAQVIEELNKEGFDDILVVDDCSSDDTFEKAKNAGAHVLKHVINRGAGGATATIIEYAKRNHYDILIIMDSDGQHSPQDAKNLLKNYGKADILIGSRLLGDIKKMPYQRRVANMVGSLITSFIFGKFIKDSQSGFRLLNKKSIHKMDITFDTFEFCSEMIGEAHKNNLKIKEIPIKVKYTQHSLNKGHGQSIKNGFKMIAKFIFK